jgi:hypothetical protein
MSKIIEYLNKRKIRHIQVYTIFNNKSYNGYSKKILLSGICKYYRRDMYEKFQWCVMEMLLFKYHKKGICLVTNVLNRMRILIMEELLFSSNVEVIIEAIQMIESINQKTMTIEEIAKRLYSFCEIVKDCNRSRTVSYFKEWFRNEGEAGFKIPFKVPDIDENSVYFERIDLFKKKGDSIKLLQLGELLLNALDKEEPYEKMLLIMRLYWEFTKIKEGSGRRYRRKKGIYLFWEIIDFHMKFKAKQIGEEMVNKWNVIFKFGLTQYFREALKERHAFGIWMLLFCVYYDSIDWNTETRKECDLLCDMSDVIDYMKEREHMGIQVVEDFVIKDWHVNRKYDIGRFARVGAYVKNEKNQVVDEKLYNRMKRYYINKKTHIGGQ